MEAIYEIEEDDYDVLDEEIVEEIVQTTHLLYADERLFPNCSDKPICHILRYYADEHDASAVGKVEQIEAEFNGVAADAENVEPGDEDIAIFIYPDDESSSTASDGGE